MITITIKPAGMTIGGTSHPLITRPPENELRHLFHSNTSFIWDDVLSAVDLGHLMQLAKELRNSAHRNRTGFFTMSRFRRPSS
jgi:hypothetical protein